MVHRRNRPLSYAFPAEEVGQLPNEPEPAAPGYVVVPWDAVDSLARGGTQARSLSAEPLSPRRLPPHKTPPAGVRGGHNSWCDTEDTVVVFETALDPRLYVGAALVRTDVLRRTDTTTYCNYKGVATYWSAVVGDAVVEDVAWSYEDPLPESVAIKGYLSFDASSRRRSRRTSRLDEQQRAGRLSLTS